MNTDDFRFALGQHVRVRLQTSIGAQGTCNLEGFAEPLVVVHRYRNVGGSPLYAVCSEPIAAVDFVTRLQLVYGSIGIFFKMGVGEDAMTAIEGSSELHQGMEAFMRSLEPAQVAMLMG